LPKPDWSTKRNAFRYTKHNDVILVFLKGARYMSLLHTSIILLDVGHCNEMGILFRCMDEAFEDAILFAEPKGNDGNISEEQKQTFHEFFQEEFESSSQPWPKTQNETV